MIETKPIIITWKNFPYYFIKSILVMIYRTTINIIALFMVALDKFLDFIDPVFDSVYGKINEKELYRIITLAASAGGGLWEALKYIGNNAASYITDPTLLSFFNSVSASLAHNRGLALLVILIFLYDFYRRKYHTNDLLMTKDN